MQAQLFHRAFERELRVYRRLWRASVFSSFLGPALFLAAMGLGLGELVDRSSGEVEGLSYLVFVTPGLLAATAMQQAAGESLWPVLGGVKWLRTFHGMVATPLGAADVYTGLLAFTGFRVVLSAGAFLAVAAAMGGVTSWWAPLAVPAAVLTAWSFSAPLSAFSATQETDGAFALVMRLVVMPLFLFSGAFFPLSQLPGWLQAIASLSPLYHGVELCRAATTGSGDLLEVGVHASFLVAVIAVSWNIGVRTFRTRLAS